MKTNTGKLWGWLSLAAFLSFNATAATYYVNVSNMAPVSPFTDWATAATHIQDAVDVSSDGDLILVTNGVYDTGGRVVYGSLTNRVVINKAIAVRSVNGPTMTVIIGYPISDNNAVRCAYLTNNASLAGFSLTDGSTLSKANAKGVNGGGIYCESLSATVSNCIISHNSAPAGLGGGAFGGTLLNCILTNNTAVGGGGAASNTLYNCFLTGNSASSQNISYGGGALGCVLSNCLVVGNYFGSANGYGGGAGYSALTGCVVSNNAAKNGGGGVAYCVVDRSLLSSNYCPNGGGVYQSSITDCLVIGNAGGVGGGANQSWVTNCVVVSNTATIGGGIYGSTSGNTIVYYNNGLNGSNYNGGTFYYCCTFPLPVSGTGNFTNAPLFLDSAGHLQSNSPCIDAGNSSLVVGSTDADGRPRIVGAAVDVGAMEYQGADMESFISWMYQYGLPNDGTADNADTDGDGMNNWQEWKASTVPTNAASVLQLASPSNSLSGMIVKWQSVGGVNYYLQRGTNLAAQPTFTSIQSNIVGQVGTTSYTDTTATNATPYFYRVGVQ